MRPPERIRWAVETLAVEGGDHILEIGGGPGVFRRRTVGAAVLLGLIPATLAIPALAALAAVSAVCSLVVAYEVLRYREARLEIRHPDLAA